MLKQRLVLVWNIVDLLSNVAHVVLDFQYPLIVRLSNTNAE